jgi:hypothetical protein
MKEATARSKRLTAAATTKLNPSVGDKITAQTSSKQCPRRSSTPLSCQTKHTSSNIKDDNSGRLDKEAFGAWEAIIRRRFRRLPERGGGAGQTLDLASTTGVGYMAAETT